MKICSQCKDEKHESEFYKDRTNSNGLSYMCKKCSYKKNKATREKNLDKITLYNKEYRKKNHKSILQREKKYREKDREEKLAKRREKRKLKRDELNKRENERRKSPEFLAKAREYNRKYYRKTVKKQLPMRQAHKMVMYALKLGIMKRPEKCENCGLIGKVEGHHDDYTKPLDVKWFCKGCHSRHHNEIKDIP